MYLLNNLKKNINITKDNIDVLFEELLIQIEKEIFPDDHMAVTRFYTLKSMMETFDGVDITNEIGSKSNLQMKNYINLLYLYIIQIVCINPNRFKIISFNQFD